MSIWEKSSNIEFIPLVEVGLSRDVHRWFGEKAVIVLNDGFLACQWLLNPPYCWLSPVGIGKVIDVFLGAAGDSFLEVPIVLLVHFFFMESHFLVGRGGPAAWNLAIFEYLHLFKVDGGNGSLWEL